jgi:hypothetical protein
MENQPNQLDFFHIVNMQASNSFGYKGKCVPWLQSQNTNYFLLEVFMGENGGSKLYP